MNIDPFKYLFMSKALHLFIVHLFNYFYLLSSLIMIRFLFLNLSLFSFILRYSRALLHLTCDRFGFRGHILISKDW